jgi:peptidoglycan/xylan/chitin deacetylase (PgdA/CDA1 family)
VTPRALVLTYHAIAAGPAPLYVEPSLLARQLDCVVDSGASVLTVSELANALRNRTLPDLAVALTFDDGFATVATAAAPLLASRGLAATVFCVSGHVGGTSDWPSQPSAAPRLPLAGTATLRDLAAAGWEIGAHGVTHRVLDVGPADMVHDELAESRRELELAVGTPVTSFAWPYGSVPDNAGAILAAVGYSAACTTQIGLAGRDASALALPRVDAHYLRHPALLTAVLDDRLPGYLLARRVLATMRRRVTADYARPVEKHR